MSKAPETIYERLKQRVSYLEKRLELIGTDGNGSRVRLPESSDGIACRDTTIENLNGMLIKANDRIKKLETVLRHLQHHCWGMSTHGIETMARDALSKEEPLRKLTASEAASIVDAFARSPRRVEPAAAEKARELFTLEEWNESDGEVLWWRFPIVEPPYVGSPLCSDWPWDEDEEGDHVDHYTHWTRIPLPSPPAATGETKP